MMTTIGSWRAKNPEGAKAIAKRYRVKKLEKDPTYETRKMQKWRAANPERSQAQTDEANAKKKERLQNDPAYREERAQQRAEYMARPGVREKRRKQWKEWAQASRYLNPKWARGRELKRNYGITLEQYDELLSAQNGCCAICGTNKAGGRGPYFNVDHCHDSDRVRALLCHGCNTGLGAFKDDPELLEKAANYVRRHRLTEAATLA